MKKLWKLIVLTATLVGIIVGIDTIIESYLTNDALRGYIFLFYTYYMFYFFFNVLDDIKEEKKREDNLNNIEQW